MNLQQAQAAVAAALTNNAAATLNRAVAFRPEIAADVRELEAGTTAQKLAPTVVRMALKGKDAAESAANLIAFAQSL
jgi:hypothetical protein